MAKTNPQWFKLGWGYVMARYVARRAAIRDTAIRSEGRAAASVSWRRRGKTSLGGLTPRASLHRLRWQLPWHQPNAQWSLVLQRRMSFDNDEDEMIDLKLSRVCWKCLKTDCP